jgi:hypothetical protein
MVRKICSLSLVLGSLLVLTLSVAFASSTKATVTLKPPKSGHIMAMVKHAFGSAKISYTANDAAINLTTDNLPKPSAIHAKVYVLWTVRGTHKLNAGALKLTGNMGGLHATTMDTKFSSLVVTAEQSKTEKAPMGTKVLVGPVMHH